MFHEMLPYDPVLYMLSSLSLVLCVSKETIIQN